MTDKLRQEKVFSYILAYTVTEDIANYTALYKTYHYIQVLAIEKSKWSKFLYM